MNKLTLSFYFLMMSIFSIFTYTVRQLGRELPDLTAVYLNYSKILLEVAAMIHA